MAHTGAGWGLADFLCLLCFRHGASAARAGVPRTGRLVQANSVILPWLTEIGQTNSRGGGQPLLNLWEIR